MGLCGSPIIGKRTESSIGDANLIVVHSVGQASAPASANYIIRAVGIDRPANVARGAAGGEISRHDRIAEQSGTEAMQPEGSGVCRNCAMRDVEVAEADDSAPV